MNRMCCVTNSYLAQTEQAETEQADIRVDKVLEIRRQLGEGTYSVAERLDVVVERIIYDLRMAD